MRKHTIAVKALIETVEAVTDKTFVSRAPRDGNGKLPPAPYVVIHPADGTDTQARFTGPKRTSHPRFIIHSVGSSYDNAAELNERIKAKFITNGVGIPIVVVNEKSTHVRWESPQPVQVDDDVKPPMIYATGELTWDADPS